MSEQFLYEQLTNAFNFGLQKPEIPDCIIQNLNQTFAVQQLNEEWDVLNLFDIVRCYETRDSGNTTISEAQLIGRGARYCPLDIQDYPDKYRRKFDDDRDHELRILEELHYHSMQDSRYLSEIRLALIDEGLLDSQREPLTQIEVEFLAQIRAEYPSRTFTEDNNYRVIGVPSFYNENKENEFRDDLIYALQNNP